MAELFLYAAMVQGAVAAVITLIGGFGDQIGLLPVAASRVIAGGEAGSWFTVGYLTYLIVGVVAMAVTSLFYFYIETVLGKTYHGIAKVLAWIHLVAGNIGVFGASIVAMIGGYYGGAAMQPKTFGGMGWTTLQVHQNILSFYSLPIAALILVGVIGFFAGGIGYMLTLHSKS